MNSLFDLFRRGSKGSMLSATTGLDDDDLWANLDGMEFSVVVPCEGASIRNPSHSADMDCPDFC